jgi:hypothetical protein
MVFVFASARPYHVGVADGDVQKIVAEEVGFEPTERLHARWFSRPVPSTARPLLR